MSINGSKGDEVNDKEKIQKDIDDGINRLIEFVLAPKIASSLEKRANKKWYQFWIKGL